MKKQFGVPEIVHHSRCLHVGVTDRRADANENRGYSRIACAERGIAWWRRAAVGYEAWKDTAFTCRWKTPTKFLLWLALVAAANAQTTTRQKLANILGFENNTRWTVYLFELSRCGICNNNRPGVIGFT